MDYLTRFFLELKEAEYASPSLPRVEEFVSGTGSLRSSEEAAAYAAMTPEQRFRSRQNAVGQLHRLLDEAQVIGRGSEARGTERKGRELPVSLHRPAETGADRSLPLFSETGTELTPEAFSRFFERDARRYG